MSNITIRQATEKDREFVIKTIIEAEKSGGDSISYCQIFSITEERFIKLVNDILDEDIDGQEMCISNFLIAEVDGEYAAAISSWIEKKDGMTSNMIKSNLFMFLLDRDIILKAAPAFTLMNEVHIPRTENELQIESGYTCEKYRGMGIIAKLINEQISRRQEQGNIFSRAQILTLKNNESGQRAYERIGFRIVQEKKSANEAILKFLPCDTKILMEKVIEY